jgi:dTDP-4-dehydrorhamnose reductase
MKVMLIGAGGQLGGDLRRMLPAENCVSLTHADVEITDPASVRRAFEGHRPDVVINTAAFHRVDDCETQAERAFQTNAIAVRALAQACHESGAVLVHFSTDYVFDGAQSEPYVETDRPAPLSVYAASKLAGEYLAAATHSRHFVIRTCGLFGLGGSRSKGGGGNFVEMMLRAAAQGKRLRVVSDQVVTPTATADLARKVIDLLQTESYGLYHITAQGSCSWYEFARTIFELEGVQADLHAVTAQEFSAPARRPAYSVLRNRRLELLGIDDLPAWQDGLKRYLADRRTASPPIAFQQTPGLPSQ